jgi:hypothetical protein
MNRTALSAFVLAAAFAGSAFAETPTIETHAFVSSKTRAEVQAELAAYKQSGVNPWSISYNPLRSFQSTASRQAVTAAYVASRDEVNALNSEDSGSSYLAQRAVDGGATNLAGQPQNAQ